MKGPPLLAWALFGLYALWISALQGVLAAPRALGAWTPDLALVLLLAWGGRLGPGRAELAALVVALARASLGADAPAALVAGYLGAALFAGLLRSGLEVDGPFGRALVAGVSAAALGLLVVSARSVALAAAGAAVAVEGARLVPLACASALAALLLAPLLQRLPGLATLKRRRR